MYVKVEVRVFATPSSPEGGNPLTIFVIPDKIDVADKDNDTSSCWNQVHSTLAQLCKWESVMVHNVSSNTATNLYFYLPSGQPISYCAHAAMGACAYIGQCKNIAIGVVPFIRGLSPGNNGVESAKVDTKTVTLSMENNLEEECVDMGVVEKLLEMIGILKSHYTTSLNEGVYPSMINSSLGRPKTIVMVDSMDVLHSATNPFDALIFRDLCDAIDSTGLYLYAACTGTSFECRQFPRYSGYPEDPATGIAASALASSLHKRGLGADFEFFQGTAMGRRSRISVSVKLESNVVECSGLVVFDSEDEIVI